MKIALALDGGDLGAPVAPSLAESGYLLIYDCENDRVLRALDGAGLAKKTLEFAQATIAADCEAIICGPIEEEPFLLLADVGCVTRYDGAGLPGREAITAMNENRLAFIRDHIDGSGCGNHQ